MIEELRRLVLVVGAAESLAALVLAELPEIAPLECRCLARRGAAGLDQIVGPLKIAILPGLKSQLPRAGRGTHIRVALSQKTLPGPKP